MVGNVTIKGQIVGTATFDGAKISAVVTIAPPINATVVFGRSGVSVHNELTGRDAVDVHPKESITGLGLTDSPEFANTQITTLQSDANGGVIHNAESTWLGATAKNVLSYLQKLVSKVFAIDGRVSALENNLIIDVTLAVDTTDVLITLPSPEERIMIEYGNANGIDNNNANLTYKVNSVASVSYVTVASRLNGFVLYIGRYGYVGRINMSVIAGLVYTFIDAQTIFGTVSTQNIINRVLAGYLEVPQPSINTILFTGTYKAGTRFKVLRER